MYLIHITDIDSVKSIIKDDYLKSNKLTGNINQGKAIYDGKNRFVYFSTIEKLFDPIIKYTVTLKLIFLDILRNINFFTILYT